MKNKISILGCGWLGFPLAKFLIKSGFKVNGSSTTKPKLVSLKEERIEPFYIDLENGVEDNVLDVFFEGSEVLIVTIPPRRVENVEELYASQFIKLIPKLPNDIKVIYISSTSVYPNVNGEIVEKTIVAPEKKGGKAIVAVEKLLEEALGERLTIIRFAGLMGIDRHPGRFLAGRKNVPNPNAPVNMIHLDDCIGLIHAVIEKNSWGEIFNGAADEHPTRREFYSKAARSLDLEAPEFTEDQNTEGKYISNTKSKKVLEYQYKHSDLLKLF